MLQMLCASLVSISSSPNVRTLSTAKVMAKESLAIERMAERKYWKLAGANKKSEYPLNYLYKLIAIILTDLKLMANSLQFIANCFPFVNFLRHNFHNIIKFVFIRMEDILQMVENIFNFYAACQLFLKISQGNSNTAIYVVALSQFVKFDFVKNSKKCLGGLPNCFDLFILLV
jgi:hypothetical protein